MILEQIHLLNFKSYKDNKITFSSEINLLYGLNGSGKTNLLDAIYCLSMTKSAFSLTESALITYGHTFFSLLGVFNRQNAKYVIQYDFTENKKKISLNKVAYSKLTDHIGEFPVVLITPYDTDLIRDYSELRRKFFDIIISQIDKKYLLNLMQYNNILKQRNTLLKIISDGNTHEYALIEAYNKKLIEYGNYICQARKMFIEQYNIFFMNLYQKISHSRERPDIQYKTDTLDSQFPKLFENNLKKDIYAQRTLLGVHKDDFVFTLDGYPVKQYASQGQQKSFVLALKLAHYLIINKIKNIKPILLLDDIFDKLDEIRITNLLKLISEGTFGQVFITDAHPMHLHHTKLIEGLGKDFCIYNVNKGTIYPI